MGKFGRWGLTVVTMVSVATAVLLVTGWGSALASSLTTSVIIANPATNPARVHEMNTDATGSIKVHEQGVAKTAVQNVDASGNIKVHEQGNANVKITNASVPVSGTVGIAGTPSVSVSNFPATQTVTGSVSSSDKTTLFGSSQVPGEVNGNNNFVQLLSHIDVSSARTIRLNIACFGTSACSTVHVHAFADNFEIDVFDIGGTVSASRTYEVPGTDLTVNAYNTNTSMLIYTSVYGRAN